MNKKRSLRSSDMTLHPCDPLQSQVRPAYRPSSKWSIGQM